MMYKVPSDGEVTAALTKVLVARGHIHSQKMLKSLVDKELARIDKGYKVSAQRLRRLALESGMVKVDTDYRETDEKPKAGACPVCGRRMKPVKNRTIEGKTITLMYKCKCGYKSGLKRKVPVLYTFTMKK